MKRVFLCMAAGLLLAAVTGWIVAGRGDFVMKNTAYAQERPPIDRAIPAKLETATFALG